MDDSKSARFVLGKLLQQHSFNVEMAPSAEDALEYLTSNQPDAIFMDHMMKGMDGLVATSVIKKNPATAHIPIVMCTSNDGEKYRAEARSHGALGTLVKPPSDDKLEAILIAIEKAIENNQLAFEKRRPQAIPQPDAIPSEPPRQTPELSEAAIEAKIEAMADTLVSARIALIEESLEAQLKNQQSELHELIEKKIDTTGSSAMNRQEIEGVLDQKLAKIGESVADQLLDMKQKLGDEIITSAKFSRQAQEIAQETAISITEQKAAEIARSTVHAPARDALNPAAVDEMIRQQISEVKKSARSQALTFSVVAAIASAGTAIGFFLLSL